MKELKHEEMDYNTVRKNFYFEEDEVSSMSPDAVKMIR
jgi:hypothetical protein